MAVDSRASAGRYLGKWGSLSLKIHKMIWKHYAFTFGEGNNDPISYCPATIKVVQLPVKCPNITQQVCKEGRDLLLHVVNLNFYTFPTVL